MGPLSLAVERGGPPAAEQAQADVLQAVEADDRCPGTLGVAAGGIAGCPAADAADLLRRPRPLVQGQGLRPARPQAAQEMPPFPRVHRPWLLDPRRPAAPSPRR